MPHVSSVRDEAVHGRVAAMLGLMPVQRTGYEEVASEVRALRDEIAALRKLVDPPPSLILTGRTVIDQFEKLTQVR